MRKSASISRLLMILAIGSVWLFPSAHASTPIFTISMHQAEWYGCLSCWYPPCVNGTCLPQVIASGDVTDYQPVESPYYGDANGEIPSTNTGYPILQIWAFYPFTYNPSALTDLHLYINYYVNAYVYAAPQCTSAWLMGQFGVANNIVNSASQVSQQSGSMPVPMTNFEYDPATTTNSHGCSHTPNINPVDSTKTFDKSLAQWDGNCSSTPQFCNLGIGGTYTFVFLFEITANPGAYIVYNNNGQPGSGTNSPTFLYTGAYGSYADFVNQNFCTILSYQSAPVTGCP